MKGLSGLLWFGVVLLVVNVAESLNCFQCSNIREGDDCKIVNPCKWDESCYSERTGHGNSTSFTLGCIKSQSCPDHLQFSIVGRGVNDQCKTCCLQDGCNKLLCEVQHTTGDGGWSVWTEWSSCSKSCGLAMQSKSRTCSNPAPANGGDNCPGNGTQERTCFLRACPVHGEWSGWAHWEHCSASCGQGLNKRHRTCTNPSPSLYGHYCIGDPVEYNICYGTDCGNSTTNEPPCDDIAIIGAGIAGSYAAWRLRHNNLSVTVYEYTNRTGGRLQTIHLPGVSDINIELGGMRFLPEVHKLMNQTAHDLGLEMIDFEPGFGFGGNSIAYLRGVHLKADEIGSDKTPYGLRPNEEHKSNRELAWELFYNGTNFNITDNVQDEDVTLHLKTDDDKELYQQSCSAVYAKMGASSEAIKFIRDVMGFYSYSGDVSAALTIPRPHPVAATAGPKTRPSVKTIKNGMDKIPKTLMKKFLAESKNHQLLPLYDLKAIIRRTDGAYDLSFILNNVTDGLVKPTNTHHKTCARKVILAVPRLSLEHIDWSVLKSDEMHNIITKSVKDAPAAKVFLVYDKPWWRHNKFNFSHAVTDLPNRQTYDFGTSKSSTESVLLASYTDMEDVKLWRELHDEGTYLDTNGTIETTNAVSSEVVDAIHTHLADLYDRPVSSIPAPISGTMSLWDQYPFGAAWHVWMPGFIWNDVQHKMIKPSDGDDVYIATGSFFHGESSAWSESALETVEEMLARMNN